MTSSSLEPAPGYGCAQCWPAGAEAAWEGRRGLAFVAELVDESHFGLSILCCSRCGQQFVSAFVEEVDWVDGDDPQYCSLMPLSGAEGELLRALNPDALMGTLAVMGKERRALRSDYPKGGPKTIYWGVGMRV